MHKSRASKTDYGSIDMQRLKEHFQQKLSSTIDATDVILQAEEAVTPKYNSLFATPLRGVVLSER